MKRVNGCGYAAPLAVVALMLAVSSCAHMGGYGGAALPALKDTLWRIAEVGGAAVADGSQTELRIADDGKVSGSTGCNRFNGTATIDGANLSFSPLATTRRACEPALMDQERGILDALQSVKRFGIGEGGRLDLMDAAGNALMRLTRAQ